MFDAAMQSRSLPMRAGGVQHDFKRAVGDTSRGKKTKKKMGSDEQQTSSRHRGHPMPWGGSSGPMRDKAVRQSESLSRMASPPGYSPVVSSNPRSAAALSPCART